MEETRESMITDRRMAYVEKLINLLNFEINERRDIPSHDMNVEINAMLEAVPLVTVSIIYSLQLADPFKKEIFQSLVRIYSLELERCLDEEKASQTVDAGG
jgi:hypothetical protein